MDVFNRVLINNYKNYVNTYMLFCLLKTLATIEATKDIKYADYNDHEVELSMIKIIMYNYNTFNT